MIIVRDFISLYGDLATTYLRSPYKICIASCFFLFALSYMIIFEYCIVCSYCKWVAEVVIGLQCVICVDLNVLGLDEESFNKNLLNTCNTNTLYSHLNGDILSSLKVLWL